jgi:hypothetical protein
MFGMGSASSGRATDWPDANGVVGVPAVLDCGRGGETLRATDGKPARAVLLEAMRTMAVTNTATTPNALYLTGFPLR